MVSNAAPCLLVLLCLGACAPVKQEAPPASAASSACATPPPATATSKLRHIPDENDPCTNSTGLPPR